MVILLPKCECVGPTQRLNLLEDKIPEAVVSMSGTQHQLSVCRLFHNAGSAPPVQGIPAYGLLPPCALTGSASAPRFATTEYVMHEHVRVCAHDVMIPDRVICPSCRTTVTPCSHKVRRVCLG